VNFLLSFIFSCSLIWAIALTFLGNPGLLRGPWTNETLLRLKRTEQLAYFTIVCLIPLITLIVNSILDQLNKKFSARLFPHTTIVPPRRVNIKKRTTSGWLFGLLLPTVLYLAVPTRPATAPLEHMDDGLRLTATAQFQKGKALYRDIFLNYGPLYEVGQTRLAFWLFGRSWDSLRKMDRLIEPLPYVATYFLILGALRRRWLTLMLFLLVTKSPFWMTPRIALPLSMMGCLVWGWRASKPWGRRIWQAGAGLLLGAALLYSLEGGLLSGATLVSFYGVWALWNTISGIRVRPIFQEVRFIAMGFLTILIPFLSWIVITGRFTAFCSNIYAVSVTALAFGAKPTPILHEPLLGFVRNPFSLFQSQGALMRLWFPVAVYIGSLSWIFGREKPCPYNEENRPIMLLTLSGIFFFMVAMGRWDMDHWWKATGPFWPLGTLLLDRVIPPLHKPFRWKEWIGALLVGLFPGRYLLFQAHPKRMMEFIENNTSSLIEIGKTSRSTNVLGPMLMKQEDEQEIREVLLRLHRWSPPDQPLFIFGNQGTFYFLSGRSNPPPYHMECYIMSESMAQAAVESLRKTPPACVMAETSGEGYAHRPFQKTLLEYIQKNYVEAERWGPHAFLVRRLHSS